MEIDLVYTYVNGNDEEWLRKRKEYPLDINNEACRFRDNQELLFSLRSVEKYAPWIRNIFILTDSNIPDWLNTEDKRIRIIHHEEFMPAEILPCYNSNVIESYLDMLPDLSEIFLYANDDMFFGNYVSEDFFVKDGKPVVRMSENLIRPTNYYKRALFRSKQLILERFGTQFDLIPTHNIDVYSKAGITGCKAEFAEEFLKVSRNRLRSDDDIQRSIFHYYMVIKDMCILKVYREYSTVPAKVADTLVKLAAPSKNLDYLFYTLNKFFASARRQLLFARNPRMVCLNDGEKTTENDLHRFHDLMMKRFPSKSSFER